MGSAESRVAAQPLAVVADALAPPSRPVVTCSLFRKQNKTAPAIPTVLPTATPMPSMQSMPRSSPTIEAVEDAKQKPTSETSVTSTVGPTVQLRKRALSLRQLSHEELTTQLLKAVKNGDLKLVERVHEIAAAKGLVLLNVRGMWESTPLIYACQYCHEPVVHWLLDKNADVHLVNEKGVSALLLASLEGMTRAVERVLTKLDTVTMPVDSQIGVVYNSAADVNVRVSPLLAASMNGHDAIVRMLVNAGAGVNTEVTSTSTGGGHMQLPLLMAAKYGHVDVVRLLMQRGADVTAVDANQNHALLLACEANKEECVVALMEEMQAKGQEEASAWKRANVYGFTALHFCAVHGHVRAASWMLKEMHWDEDVEFVNAISATRKETAVLMASRKKQLEMVRLLMESGADASMADRGGTAAVDVLKKDKRENLVVLWEEMTRRREEKQTGERVAAEDEAKDEKNAVRMDEGHAIGANEGVEEGEEGVQPVDQEDGEVKKPVAEEIDGQDDIPTTSNDDKERRERPDTELTQAGSDDLTEPTLRDADESGGANAVSLSVCDENEDEDEVNDDCSKETATPLSLLPLNPLREDTKTRSKKVAGGNRRGTGYITSGPHSAAITKRSATMPQLMREADEEQELVEEEADKCEEPQVVVEAHLELKEQEQEEARHTIVTEETERVDKEAAATDSTPKGEDVASGSGPSSLKKERHKKKKHKHSRKKTSGSGSEPSPTKPRKHEIEDAQEQHDRTVSIRLSTEAVNALDDDF